MPVYETQAKKWEAKNEDLNLEPKGWSHVRLLFFRPVP